jgi:hypothetical protein
VARDDGKSPDAHRQMKANLPGGARTQITSLAVLARADFEQPTAPLLPTPSASDSTGAEKETREARQDDRTGGPSLRDLPKLLPTPTVQDGANNAGPSQYERNSDPLNVVAAKTSLFPTPNASDGPKGGPNRRDGQGNPYLSGIGRVLPTPMANPENPGAGEELRAAIVYGEERRNETGVDTMGRPNLGRPSTGEPTRPPSAAGKISHDQHPDQLTIGDA